MARRSKREVAKTPLWSVNKVVNVVVHGDDATDHIRALFRHEGRVIGHRVGESREHGRLGIGRKGGRIEAKVSNRIYIEDRIAGDIARNRGFRCGVVGRCNRISAKNFAGGL